MAEEAKPKTKTIGRPKKYSTIEELRAARRAQYYERKAKLQRERELAGEEPPKRRVGGRPRKYATDEERIAAKKAQMRQYQERQKAMVRAYKEQAKAAENKDDCLCAAQEK